MSKRRLLTVALLLVTAAAWPAAAQSGTPAQGDAGDGKVILNGFEGELGEMPKGWKTLFREQVGMAELREEDGVVYLHTTRTPFSASHDEWLEGPTPMTASFKVRVTGTSGLDQGDMPNVSFIYGAVGGLEKGFGGSWIAKGDTDGWVEVTKELDGGPSGTRRIRVSIGHPGDRGAIDVKDLTIIARPRQAEEDAGPTEDPIFSPSQNRRQVDRSRITGADIDESNIAVTIHVDSQHANASDLNPGVDRNRPKKTIESAIDDFRSQHSAFTGATKVLIHPGVYRLTNPIDIDKFMYATRRQLLVLEGAKAGEVVISGAITEGFEPDTWELIDAERRVYRHEWPYDWGMANRGYYSTNNILSHRRELIVLNGQMLTPRILEAYSYVDKRGREYNEVGLLIGEGKPKGSPGYTFEQLIEPTELQPGEFGVIEKSDDRLGDSIYLRLPEGVQSLDEALIEVGYSPTLLVVRNKQNLVLRNLVFRHAASWYINYFDEVAIEIGPTPIVSDEAKEPLHPRNILIENCVVEENRASGVKLSSVQNLTIRNCVFRDNGANALGMGHTRNAIIENVTLTGNNRTGQLIDYLRTPHGSGGIDLSGVDMLFRNVDSSNNYGAGLRGDVWAANLIFEDCRFNHNTFKGHWHEISWGPILLQNCEMIGNDKGGYFSLNVLDVTLDNCIIANNGEHQVGVSLSTTRTTPINSWFRKKDEIEMLIRPLGWEILNCTIVGDDPDVALIERAGGDVDAYTDFVREGFTGRNNRYWHTSRENAFESEGKWQDRNYVDLEGWKKATNSEHGSVWAPPEAPLPVLGD